MNIRNTISTPIIQAAVGLLAPYAPELNAANLIAAIKQYRTDGGVRVQLMTRREAAAALGVSMPTVHRLINDGKLRRVQVSANCVRIDAESVNAILEAEALA